MECLSQFVLRFQEFVFGCSARASPNKRIKALTLADYFRRFPLYCSLITLKHFNFKFFFVFIPRNLLYCFVNKT